MDGSANDDDGPNSPTNNGGSPNSKLNKAQSAPSFAKSPIVSPVDEKGNPLKVDKEGN